MEVADATDNRKAENGIRCHLVQHCSCGYPDVRPEPPQQVLQSKVTQAASHLWLSEDEQITSNLGGTFWCYSNDRYSHQRCREGESGDDTQGKDALDEYEEFMRPCSRAGCAFPQGLRRLHGCCPSASGYPLCCGSARMPVGPDISYSQNISHVNFFLSSTQ